MTALRHAPPTVATEPALLLQFVGIHVPSFSCVGTPAQLRSFLGLVRKGMVTPQYKARVCFDLDRLLRALLSRSGGERTVSARPVESNMRVLQVGDGKQGTHDVRSTSEETSPGAKAAVLPVCRKGRQGQAATRCRDTWSKWNLLFLGASAGTLDCAGIPASPHA